MVDKDEIIDKMRFMVSPLSRLADNIAKGLHKVKCKDCMSGLEYVAGKDDILTFKCVDCNKNYEKVFDKNFNETFENAYRFCDGDINKFCLKLRKGVYSYE